MLFPFSASVAGVLFSCSAVVQPLSDGLVQIGTGNCFTGIIIVWWKRNHHHNAHHIAFNSLDFDPDLQHMPLFVVSSKLFALLTSCYYDRKMKWFHGGLQFQMEHQDATSGRSHLLYWQASSKEFGMGGR